LSEKLRKLWTFSRNGGDAAPDPWLHEALGALDPAERSPSYWSDFKRAVLVAARPELARRQRLAELTVSEVVFSWSRALVPAAVMAAATAGLLLFRSDESGPFVRLEEALSEGIEVSEDATPFIDLEVEITLASESF
jgi:hypothetical protein